MKCHICNRSTDSFLHEKTGIIYYHCKGCEYIFKSSEYYQSIEVQKERYDLHENSEENEGYRAYFQRFLDFVLPLVGRPKTALDFGCGRSKLLAMMLKENGVECNVYDPLYHPDISNNSKKYELIVSTEVFEHLHDPKIVFEGLLSRLVPGGYLALQTQFHPNNAEVFKKWYYHQDPTHIVFFRPQTFKILAEMYKCDFVGDNGKNMVVFQRDQELRQ